MTDGSINKRTAGLAVVWLAALSWVALDLPIFGSVVPAYLAAWIFVSVLVVRTPAFFRSGRPLVLVLISLAVTAAVAAAFAASRSELFENEHLDGLFALLSDRARRDADPRIAPATVHTDHPQQILVQASGAETLSMELGGMVHFDGEALGHGLFRFVYDPRRDGVISAPSGPVDALIELDGKTKVTRPLGLVHEFAHPRQLTSLGGVLAAVSEETDTLFVVPRGASSASELVTGDGPSDVVLLAAGAVAVVSHRYDPDLWFIDTKTTKTLRRLRVGVGQNHLAISPAEDLIALAFDATPMLALVRLNDARLPIEHHRVETPVFIDRLRFGSSATSLAVTDRRSQTLARLELDLEALALKAPPSTLPLGRPATALTTNPAGDRIFVAISDYLPKSSPGENHHIEDQIVEVDFERFRILRRTPTLSLDEAGRAVGGASPAALFAGEETLDVAFAGTGDVATYGLDTMKVRGRWSPEAVTLSAVTRLSDGRLAAASAPDAVIFIQSADGSTKLRVGPSDAELENRDPAALRRRQGERIFYEATIRGVSCQSCHLELGTDFSIHDIGHDTPRPTLTARGVAETAPFLRGASYAKVETLHAELEKILGGYVRKEEARAEKLAAFVEGLSPEGAGGPPAPAAALREGFDAFVQARCPLCHTPPAFTSLIQIPESFVFPDEPSPRLLDTPSLLGVSRTPPYLFDGRSPSLETVVGKDNGANRHGNVRALSRDQRAALIHFLEAL